MRVKHSLNLATLSGIQRSLRPLRDLFPPPVVNSPMNLGKITCNFRRSSGVSAIVFVH